MKPEEKWLEELFKQLPDEELPAAFRDRVMQQVYAEAKRAHQRSERWGWVAIIAASLCMIGLAVLVFLYLDLPPVRVALPESDSWLFFFYIGVLTLLLGADHLFRQYVKRKHS